MRSKLWVIAAVFFIVSRLPVYGDANVLVNPGFEDGTSAWSSRNCSIRTVTSPVRSESRSGQAYNRTDSWQGIQQDLLGKMVVGQTYQVSGWVRTSTSANSSVQITFQKTVNGEPLYEWAASGTANNSGWTYLSGSYTLTVEGVLSELYVYFEGPDSGVDIYVDDAVVFGPEAGTTDPEATGLVDVNTRHQVIEGFGAAGAWYEGTLVALGQVRPEIYDVLFGDLGLDIYRLRNAYDQDGGSLYMSRSAQIISAGEASLGRPLHVLVSCWSPPAYLKSNGQTQNGGTLASDSGGYQYAEFADWWADSITAWAGVGVEVDYLSIQNEPDWTASWDTCRYDPTETSSIAGYAEAFEAVYGEMYSRFGSSMPKMIGPETTGFYGAAGHSLSDYVSALIHPNHVYGYAHHLYNIAAGDDPDAYLGAMQNFNSAWGSKPLFQTEYEKTNESWPDALHIALLLHNSLTVEEVSAYLYWDLFWGESGSGFVSISPSTYTIYNDYYGFKHFSAFIHSGWQRVEATTDSTALRISAYISPDGQTLSVVVINTSADTGVSLTPSFSGFSIDSGTIYRTSQTQNCVSAGSYTGGAVNIAAQSVVTLSLSAAAVVPQTLTVSSTAGGAVTTPGEGTYDYPPGSAAAIVAAAAPDYHFTGWTGSAAAAGKVDDPQAESTTVMMDGDYTVIANFEADPWLYGDFTGDGTVDIEDLPLFMGYWMTEECGPVDIDGDCLIDLAEFAEFVRNWLL